MRRTRLHELQRYRTTYHITTRLSDGDAGDTRTFRKKSTLTVGGRSQQIAEIGRAHV
jgi:hypothetical protein